MYIQLVKWTGQGVEKLRNVPGREDWASATARSFGGAHTVFFTMGEFDAVAIVEAPDDETMAAFALEMSTHGNIRTNTMRAFTRDEFFSLIDRMGTAETGPNQS